MELTPDVLEALSRKYSNDIVSILPLKSTRWAVFNSQRRLCAIVEAGEVQRAVMEVVAKHLAELPLPGTREWHTGPEEYKVHGTVIDRSSGPPLIQEIDGQTTFRGITIKVEDKINLKDLDL